MLRRLPLLLVASLTATTLTLWAVRRLLDPPALAPPADLDLRNGDLLFQSMGGRQGEAIALATGSPWTHVGMAFRTGEHWQVIEAVGPVKYTPLAEWLTQGDGAEGQHLRHRPGSGQRPAHSSRSQSGQTLRPPVPLGG